MWQNVHHNCHSQVNAGATSDLEFVAVAIVVAVLWQSILEFVAVLWQLILSRNIKKECDIYVSINKNIR